MAEKEAPEAGRRLHVTVLLVASRRALDNALSELGFAEDDDRVIEHDGRLAFLTCTHEEDCDDLFALIAELSARSESWELQSRIDTEAGRGIGRWKRSTPRSTRTKSPTLPKAQRSMSKPPKACRR